jgi:hypothetical protein
MRSGADHRSDDSKGAGMRGCQHCGAEIAAVFRYCPWCAAPQRRKLVEFFRPDPRIAHDDGKALRVSRYLDQRHARFSIWHDGAAVGAVSLDDAEADRLASFLTGPSAPRPALLDQLRGLRRRRAPARPRQRTP